MSLKALEQDLILLKSYSDGGRVVLIVGNQILFLNENLNGVDGIKTTS